MAKKCLILLPANPLKFCPQKNDWLITQLVLNN